LGLDKAESFAYIVYVSNGDIDMRSFELISNLHKDARGTRPTADWMAAFDAQNEAEKTNMFDSLCEELDATIADDAARHEAARVAFELRINGMAEDYAVDQATALRWDMEGHDVHPLCAIAAHGTMDQEVEFYLWQQGLASSEFAKWVAVAHIAYKDLVE